jgi:hypothetical protein
MTTVPLARTCAEGYWTAGTHIKFFLNSYLPKQTFIQRLSTGSGVHKLSGVPLGEGGGESNFCKMCSDSAYSWIRPFFVWAGNHQMLSRAKHDCMRSYYLCHSDAYITPCSLYAWDRLARIWESYLALWVDWGNSCTDVCPRANLIPELWSWSSL